MFAFYNLATEIKNVAVCASHSCGRNIPHTSSHPTNALRGRAHDMWMCMYVAGLHLAGIHVNTPI